MKTIAIGPALTTGIEPVFASVRSIEVEDDPVGEGGFGVAYRARCVGGRSVTPMIVKLLNDDGRGLAKHGLETVRELQRRLASRHADLMSTTGRSILDAVPALLGVPQLSFEGTMAGRAVLGYVAYDLCAAGFEDFGRVLADDARARAFQALPLQARLRLASQLVQAFDFLSSQLCFIHADIKAEALFVDMTRLRCALIDFDSGALARHAADTPTTFGTRQDWLAPEIVRQLDAPGNTARRIGVNLHSDTWSVNISIHYLLFGFHPLFFLTEISERSMKAYLNRFRWPEVTPDFAYFRKDYAATHATYLGYMRSALPREIRERLAFTIERGYHDPSARTSYGQWRTVLNAQNRPAIRTFTVNRRLVVDAAPVSLAWDVRGAARLALTGIGDVTGRTHLDVQVRRDTVFELVLTPDNGPAQVATLQVEVSKAAPAIHRFSSSPGLLTDASPARLEWHVTGAERVWIDQGIGDVTGHSAFEVRPRTDVAYTLWAESYFGMRVSRQAMVTTSKEPPRIDYFRADRTLLKDARPLELSWRVSHGAYEVELEPLGPVAPEGTLRVSQTTDTVYVLRAKTWFGVVVTQRLQVRVSRDAPVVNILRAHPSVVLAGSASVLDWSVTGAETVQIEPMPGKVAAAGRVSTNVDCSTVFRLTAESWCGVRSSASVRLTVLTQTGLGQDLGLATHLGTMDFTTPGGSSTPVGAMIGGVSTLRPGQTCLDLSRTRLGQPTRLQGRPTPLFTRPRMRSRHPASAS